MDENIVIGKHTLESLTSGMYSDPYVVYREYIQNCVDSIDEAIAAGILTDDDARITVSLFPNEHKISIEDNGIGVSSENAEKTLISIGNSKKTSETSRGFRGIGRLAALSYCRKLTFSTSTAGESISTVVTIDADRLSALLSMDSTEDTSIISVLREVYSIAKRNEKQSAHYFRVILEGIDESSRLTSYDEVLDYLTQNTPVPYDPVQFVWGKELVGRLRKEGFNHKSYNVFLSYGKESHQIYKPYKDSFIVDKGKNISDSIKDIEIIRTILPDGQLSSIGWIGRTSYLGSIYDRTVKGIRVRKGNILIGDQQTMNAAFKDPRFNGWSIGEIFAIDHGLIPNARRDNFEKNASFFSFLEQVKTLAAQITKEIRSASLERNSDLSKTLEKIGQTKHAVESALDTGISGPQKGAMKQKLLAAQEEVSRARATDNSEEYYRQIAFDELDMLIGKLAGATSYKALNSLEKLSNTEKRILERVFMVIERQKASNSDSIIEAILEEFAMPRDEKR